MDFLDRYRRITDGIIGEHEFLPLFNVLNSSGVASRRICPEAVIQYPVKNIPVLEIFSIGERIEGGFVKARKFFLTQDSSVLLIDVVASIVDGHGSFEFPFSVTRYTEINPVVLSPDEIIGVIDSSGLTEGAFLAKLKSLK